MKLKNVLKGHANDDSVFIKWRGKTISWSGRGILHITSRYVPEWLEKEVSNTTKRYNGDTVIFLK